MDHFTSLTPCERDETQARSLTRRRFLGKAAVGAFALGAAVTLASPASATQAPKTGLLSASTIVNPMTGAEYVALLGGVVREKVYNGYVEKRWLEIAAGPLVEALDNRTLAICPQCLFVNYPRVPCPMCRQWAAVKPDDVAEYVASLRQHFDDLPGMMEEFLTEQRVEQAVDLFGGPDSAEFCGQTLYIREMLRSEAQA